MFFFLFLFRCLGLKSPFIEFKAQMEVLSNLSITLNTTDPNGSFGNNMMSGNSFSYPLEAAGNHTVQKQYLDMVKKQQKWMIPSTENPIVLAAMNNKKEVTLIESKEQMDGKRSIDHIDRKYIIPLALKVATPSITTTTTTTTTSTRKPPVLPDTSPNIDDLKRHILMLQNLTKNDENFQSKFVVFPSLQRSAEQMPSTTPPNSVTSITFTTIFPSQSFETMSSTIRSTSTRTTTKRATIATKRRPSLNVAKQTWPILTKDEPQKSAEKITIVPQVFLQNDQTPMNDDSFERPPLDDAINYQRQSNSPQKFSINDPKPTFLSSSTKRNQYMSASNVHPKQPKKNTNTTRNKEKQLRREMRKKCKEAPSDQKQNCTKAFQISFNLTSAAAAAAIRSAKTKTSENQSNGSEIRSNGSRSNVNYVPPHRNNNMEASMHSSMNMNKRPNIDFDSNGGQRDDDDDEEALKQSILQRTIRSHRRHQRRNASAVVNSMSRRDYPYSIGTPITTINETVSADVAAAAYKEKIDLNPDLCYKITGLSYGQQKLCASNTQIMPAISRGARAAIQVTLYVRSRGKYRTRTQLTFTHTYSVDDCGDTKEMAVCACL